ncbi:hypothetical protein ABPG74_005462 [Tetrahymena malaccensis]
MSSSTRQTNLFQPDQAFYKVQQSLYFNPNCVEGSVTVVDVTQQLKNFIKIQKQNQKNIKSMLSKNNSNNNKKDDKDLNTKISTKGQLKLSKIRTSFQRRCQTRAISQNSKVITTNISIKSNVYDTHSKDFYRMCTYYALIKPDFYQNNQKGSKQLDELLYQNSNNKIIPNCLSSQVQSNSQSIYLINSNSASINKESNKYEHFEISSNQNQVDDRIIFRRNAEGSSQNQDYKNIKSEQIGQFNKSKPQDTQQKILIEREHLQKNGHSHNIYQDQTNYQNQTNFNQSLKPQNQPKQQNKRKYQCDDSLNQNNEEVKDVVQKHIKNEQKEENINIFSKKSKEECLRDSNSQQQIIYLNNQPLVKNNQNKPDQNINYQYFNQSSAKIDKNVHKTRDFQKQNSYSIQNNKKDKSISKLFQYYEELIMLTEQNSSNHHQQSILDKCIYLTENSYTHSIIQNFLANFDTVSDSIKADYQIKSKPNEEISKQKELIQQIGSDTLKKERTFTCFSRSSATTQHINTLALTSTLSISNAQENSASQEIIKLENNEINDHTVSCFTENPNLRVYKASSNIQNCQQPNQGQQYLKEIPETVQDKNQNQDSIKKHQQEQLTGSFSLTQQYEKNYVSKCKSFFKLNSLTKQQQMQFKFSQYKKRNSSFSSPKAQNASCEEGPSGLQFKSICENQENQNFNKISHKFGKYHNFNKLFMYNVLNMFQPNNLANMKVPEQISKEVQQLISKIKSSAKNNYKVEGKYAFDYFSHAHYNILFFQLNNKNIPILSQQEEYLNLYKQCFNVNLNESVPSHVITYINLIKLFCYQIFIQCIREDEIQIDASLSQENLKNQYTLKVIRGVKKLSNGIIIKRF